MGSMLRLHQIFTKCLRVLCTVLGAGVRNSGHEETIGGSRKVNKTLDELLGLSPGQNTQALSRSVNCNALIHNFFRRPSWK